MERLGAYIDELQIHRLDKKIPKAEVMRSLNDVVSQAATEFAQLQLIADSMQNYYNLLYREEEREMIPFCNEFELEMVGLIPWSPNARILDLN